MIKKLNNYIIEYNECDLGYIDDIINNFDMNKILSFFKIEKLSKPLYIKLFDNIENYAKVRNYEISPSSVGNTHLNGERYEILILSFKEIVKRKGHENHKLDYIWKLLMHEFTHVCHMETGNLYNSLIWVREGIAICLSNQYDEEYRFNCCSSEDLINDKMCYYINYYTMMDYALNTYGNDYVYKLTQDKKFSIKETSKLYIELNEKINNIYEMPTK